jgi:release factor glutamine methyltransferase
MTLLHILTSSTDYLRARGVESPRLQAELLLSHVLAIPRLQLYLQFERELDPAELDKLRPLLKLRGQRTPLQHLTGSVSFAGLELKSSPKALIPRPETELLATRAADWVRPLPPGRLADVGTGSGCLALALAHLLPGWTVLASDLSPDALALARENGAAHPSLPVTWHQGHLLDPLEGPFDLIVANLPYLSSAEMAALQEEVKADPALALDGGPDGLDLIRQLIPRAAALSPRLYLEIGPGQGESVADLCRQAGYTDVIVETDLTDRVRFVRAGR